MSRDWMDDCSFCGTYGAPGSNLSETCQCSESVTYRKERNRENRMRAHREGYYTHHRGTPPVIAFDVDDVLADLIPAWLDVYHDCLGGPYIPFDTVRDWNFTGLVPEEDREKFYGILKNNAGGCIYNRVEPCVHARTAVQLARKLGRVIFVTTCLPGTQPDDKLKWLKDWGFFKGVDNPRQDFFPVTDKSLVACDWLIDDKPDNAERAYRKGFLVSRPHNQDFQCINSTRVSDALGAVSRIAKYLK